jgi:Cystathionine beta-lyases/cystathionine gamma-synthases
VICRPLEHGADLVIHSATKYIGGHSDTTGGVVTGRIELISSIRGVRVDTGGSLSPDDAFLLRRGLETLPLRVRRACSTASVFAAALSRHPAVLRIDYPGLPEHSGHQVARRLFDAGPEGVRFGAIVTVTPHGGRDAGMAFADKLRLSPARHVAGRDAHRGQPRGLHHAPAAGRPGARGRGASTRARYASPSAWRTPRT